MSGKAVALAALLLLALLPTMRASELAQPAGEQVGCAKAPPCGYIVPQLSLDFPDKPPCKAATLGGEVDLSKCLQLPAKGGSVTQKGVLRWYWDITQDGDYPIDPTTPIVISFSGTSTNPKWMDLKVDPVQFTIDAAAMGDPQNLKVDPAAQKVWFWYEKAITVTITRTGDPDAAGIQKIANAEGVQKVFLKAKSNSSGSYFKEAFGVEEFRFNAYADPAIEAAAKGAASGAAGHDSPALSPLAALGMLVAALVVVRRRRD